MRRFYIKARPLVKFIDIFFGSDLVERDEAWQFLFALRRLRIINLGAV